MFLLIYATANSFVIARGRVGQHKKVILHYGFLLRSSGPGYTVVLTPCRRVLVLCSTQNIGLI